MTTRTHISNIYMRISALDFGASWVPKAQGTPVYLYRGPLGLTM